MLSQLQELVSKFHARVSEIRPEEYAAFIAAYDASLKPARWVQRVASLSPGPLSRQQWVEAAGTLLLGFPLTMVACAACHCDNHVKNSKSSTIAALSTTALLLWQLIYSIKWAILIAKAPSGNLLGDLSFKSDRAKRAICHFFRCKTPAFNSGLSHEEGYRALEAVFDFSNVHSHNTDVICPISGVFMLHPCDIGGGASYQNEGRYCDLSFLIEWVVKRRQTTRPCERDCTSLSLVPMDESFLKQLRNDPRQLVDTGKQAQILAEVEHSVNFRLKGFEQYPRNFPIRHHHSS